MTEAEDAEAVERARGVSVSAVLMHDQAALEASPDPSEEALGLAAAVFRCLDVTIGDVDALAAVVTEMADRIRDDNPPGEQAGIRVLILLAKFTRPGRPPGR